MDASDAGNTAAAVGPTATPSAVAAGDAQAPGVGAGEQVPRQAAALHLASVCADFLGAALEAAEEHAENPSARERAVPLSAPTVTLRLSEAARCITTDVLGARVAAFSVPVAAPALSRMLTNGASAREWASRLWHAGVSCLHARIISPADACLHDWKYLVADEVSADDNTARAWTLPLAQTESTPLSAELRGNGGFQLMLELRSTATERQLPELQALLSRLVRSSTLLAPAADLQLEVERVARAPLDASAPPTDLIQPQTPPTTMLVSSRSGAAGGSKLERLKQAAAAHLATCTAALGEQVEGAVRDDSGVPVEAVLNTVQSAGFAQLKTGTGDKRVTWTVTAVLASSSAAAEPREDNATDVGGAPDAAACLTPVYCFVNSVLQQHPPAALLDVLRAKATAAEWKQAFGLVLLGCEDIAVEHVITLDSSFSSCLTLRFAQGDSPTVHPALIVLHRRCSQPLPRNTTALPKLGRRRELALMKAALFAALRDFKAATGGGSRFERNLRTHGFSAVAAAVSKMAVAGGEHLQARGAVFIERGLEAASGPDETQAGALEKAVLASLLETLTGDLAAHPPALDVGTEAPEDEAEPCLDSSAAQEPSPGARARVGKQLHSRDASPALDGEDVFPQRRRIDGSAMRSMPPAPVEQQSDEDASAAEGWFL